MNFVLKMMAVTVFLSSQAVIAGEIEVEYYAVSRRHAITVF